MTKLEQAIAKAKAGLTTAARKKLPLSKGDTVTLTNRLYAVVDTQRRLRFVLSRPMIYETRKGATEARDGVLESAKLRVVRLNDITGIVQ